MDRYDEQAANIVNQSALLQNYPAAGKHVAGMIASALRAAAGVQEGHIRDDKGVERKVLGTLPLTADGCVAMPGATVFFPWFAVVARGFVRHESHGPELLYFVESTTATPCGRTVGVRTFLNDCYSTREAAEAASKAVPNG